MTNVVTAETPGAVEVTVWDLELLADPNPEVAERADVSVVKAVAPAPELARFFYAEVGRDWNWRGRSEWSRAQWSAESELSTYHMWSAWSDGSPVGYFTLQEDTLDTAGNTELVHFGLLPRWHGRGLGSWLLGVAIQSAWALPSTTRMWLHTCSLDGPHAKDNYLARGFRQCGERTEHQLLLPAD